MNKYMHILIKMQPAKKKQLKFKKKYTVIKIIQLSKKKTLLPNTIIKQVFPNSNFRILTTDPILHSSRNIISRIKSRDLRQEFGNVIKKSNYFLIENSILNQISHTQNSYNTNTICNSKKHVFEKSIIIISRSNLQSTLHTLNLVSFPRKTAISTNTRYEKRI